MKHPAYHSGYKQKDRYMPRRKNLWYSLFLLTGGGVLMRLSFLIPQRTIAAAAMIVGTLLFFAAFIVFWINFRE